MRVGIIGAGAAGCFCAVVLKRLWPEADVTVLERGSRPMAKLAITGGGRCNLTNTFRRIDDLSTAYPRGARLMKRLFRQFGPEETRRWWTEAGVRLTVQEDECVFPQSQDAMQVVGALWQEMNQAGVKVITRAKVTSITDGEITWETQNLPQQTKEATRQTEGRQHTEFDYIVIATGGSPRPSGLDFLGRLGVETVPPVPSLFALNAGDAGLHALTGTVVDDCLLTLAGTKLRAQGTLLITHFGLSGPAMLRLSSYAARLLAERDYRTTLTVNWMQGQNEEDVRRGLQTFLQSPRLITNHHPQHLTARHWAYLLSRARIAATQRWDALNRKELNRLLSVLTADPYPTLGRCAYKGEFVTCGGVSLREIDPDTLALKNHPHILLAGEVLDVDGITGGFNLQAAWTMGYVVAHTIAQAAGRD